MASIYLNRQVKVQSFWEQFLKLLEALFVGEKPIHPDDPPIKPTDEMTVDPKPIEPVKETLAWETPEKARHSVRVICDEEGLTVEQKNTLCATVGAESGWKPRAINKNVRDGIVKSIDYGICQINDYWHIGPTKYFKSPEEVLSNPEKCIRWMCKMWKAEKRNLLAAYNNGSYKRYL